MNTPLAWVGLAEQDKKDTDADWHFVAPTLHPPSAPVHFITTALHLHDVRRRTFRPAR